MKVLLLTSYLGDKELPVFPVGLSCIQSSLNGHDVKIFDLNLSPKPFEEMKKIITGYSPDVIGISLRNIDSTNKRTVTFYYKTVKDMIDVIKSCSDAYIVVGGSGFSIFADEIMKDESRIDYGVFLEGEITFSQLLDNLRTPENVSSLYYRKDGNVVYTGPGSLPGGRQMNIIKKGEIPVEKYKQFRDAIGIETKRGCSLHCIYCIYPFLNGRQYRLRDHSIVVDEIEYLFNEHGMERFMFVDSVFNIPQKHAQDICREIIKRKLKVKWSAWFNEKYLDRELITLAKDAGCDNFIFSPDGFLDDVLEKLGKNLTRNDILKAYHILEKESGVEINYNFFKNPPGQNFSNLLSIAWFVIRAKMKLRRRVHFEFNSLRIEPHTKLHEIALQEGIVKSTDNLLSPAYYTQKKTRYIEKVFDFMLRLKGL